MVLSTFFFFPFFGFGFVMYFLPSIIALARSKRDITGDFFAEPVSGLEHHRLGGGTDLGREARCARGGEVSRSLEFEARALDSDCVGSSGRLLEAACAEGSRPASHSAGDSRCRYFAIRPHPRHENMAESLSDRAQRWGGALRHGRQRRDHLEARRAFASAVQIAFFELALWTRGCGHGKHGSQFGRGRGGHAAQQGHCGRTAGRRAHSREVGTGGVSGRSESPLLAQSARERWGTRDHNSHSTTFRFTYLS